MGIIQHTSDGISVVPAENDYAISLPKRFAGHASRLARQLVTHLLGNPRHHRIPWIPAPLNRTRRTNLDIHQARPRQQRTHHALGERRAAGVARAHETNLILPFHTSHK